MNAQDDPHQKTPLHEGSEQEHNIHAAMYASPFFLCEGATSPCQWMSSKLVIPPHQRDGCLLHFSFLTSFTGSLDIYGWDLW